MSAPCTKCLVMRTDTQVLMKKWNKQKSLLVTPPTCRLFATRSCDAEVSCPPAVCWAPEDEDASQFQGCVLWRMYLSLAYVNNKVYYFRKATVTFQGRKETTMFIQFIFIDNVLIVMRQPQWRMWWTNDVFHGKVLLWAPEGDFYIFHDTFENDQSIICFSS